MISIKKKYTLCLLFIGICISTLAQSSFEIRGKINGVTSDSVVLYKIINMESEVWLKTKMDNSEFTLKGTVNGLPELCRIQVGPYKLPNKTLFIEPGIIYYTCDIDTKVNRPKLPTFYGTPTLEKLNAYNEPYMKYHKEARALFNKLAKEEQILSAEQKVLINRQIDSLSTRLANHRDSCIRAFSNSVVGPYIVFASYMNADNIAMIKKYQALFTPEIRKSRIAKEIDEFVAETEKFGVGAVVPAFTMKDINGKIFDIASMKGKVYMIDFWASWCGPCRKENPNVVKLYNELHPKGFEIIGISLDKEHTKWKAAVEKDGLPWIHISDLKFWDNDVAKLMKVTSVPTTILVDSKGKIAARGLSGAELRNAIEKLLK